ncbi:MAG: YbaB/EbfC family nucleoid-associated protein [Thermaerobacter sp.]|nr:YbaB/EbfC family nucleoid-associated protein [Thermaerobacter sp.]
MGFNPQNMNKMMKQVQQMQKQMAEAQEALGQETVEATAGGGMVRVVMTGHGEIVSVEILREAVDPDDVEMLEDLVLSAVREGQDKARALAEERLGAITGGMGLPGGLF